MRRLALALAIALRLPQAALRWDEVSWQYAAYTGDVVDALRAGHLPPWTGLHPPLWSVLHALAEILLPIPAIWLLSGALASITAVWLVARRDPLAGLLLATAPVQIHYCAEVNDYPLLALLVAATWISRERAADTGRWWPLALVGVLAAWTHVLAGVVAILAILSLPARPRWRALGVVVLGALPLLPTVVALLAEPDTFHQPPFRAALVATAWLDRFGPLPLLLAPAMILGTRRAPALAAGWAGAIAFIALTVTLGVAAPHQFPYVLALGAPAVLLAARAPLRPWLVALALAQGVQVGAGELQRLDGLGHDRAWEEPLAQAPPRAIDVALDEITEGWSCTGAPTPSCTGDALVLLSPPGLNDDDKRRTSPVLWRLRPWWSMPTVRPYDFRTADFRHGQPRRVRGPDMPDNGVVVYVIGALRPELDQAIAAHHRMFLVLYNANQSLAGQARERFGSPQEVGTDLLFRLTAPPAAG